jgi:chromosome segregation ATPase
LSFESQLSELTENNILQLQNLTSNYEEKLSNTLIHSNLSNTKLTEELSKAQLEGDHFKEKVKELIIHIDSQNSTVEDLSTQLLNTQQYLKNEGERLVNLNLEFETFKQNSSLSSSEQVNQLNLQIENLNAELQTLGNLFENTTNLLAETETQLETANEELTNSLQQITALTLQVDELKSTIYTNEIEFETQKSELESSTSQSILSTKTVFENFKAELEHTTKQSLLEKQLEFENFKSNFESESLKTISNQEIEFQKLLVENTSLINEIDLAQDKVEAQESEIDLLKAELNDLSIQSIARAEELKETLSTKNYELTNLQGNNSALKFEVEQLKSELENLQNQLQFNSQSNEQLTSLQHNFDSLTNEKHTLLSEINLLHSTIGSLNNSVDDLNSKISSYETEIENLKSSTKAEEQDAFIDRLFLQIDELSHQRLSLLDEKEQMANQLLKMNDVVGELSQNIDSQNINVTDLNNHRKNIILANGSTVEKQEKSQMKNQINDLVREIDKCIALLSA